jgi:NAD(P)H dehydrogenase (quinone)
MRYFITGATGRLGRAVVARLLRTTDPDSISLGVHDLAKAEMFSQTGCRVTRIDYSDMNMLPAAFFDTDVLIYIPSEMQSSLRRVIELEHVLAAAERAGVGSIVAMGYIADQERNPFGLSAYYGYLTRRLSSTALAWTVIRDGVYADIVAGHLPSILRRGKVRYPMGRGAISFISIDDCAEAFATVAQNPELLKQRAVYTVTAQKAYSGQDLAALISDISGTQVRYEPMEAVDFAALYDEPAEGDLQASLYQAAALGYMNETGGDFASITGHEPKSLADVLTESLPREL